MMKKEYLLIYRNEDTPNMMWFTKDDLLEALKGENLLSDCEPLEKLPDYPFDEFPLRSYVIIKGEMVFPQVVKRAVEWQIP